MAESAKAKRSEETREAIVNVCIRMFAERGFVSTSLDEIGRAAAITKGAIYWHFENKDALFTAILTRIREIWDEKCCSRCRSTAALAASCSSYSITTRSSSPKTRSSASSSTAC